MSPGPSLPGLAYTFQSTHRADWRPAATWRGGALLQAPHTQDWVTHSVRICTSVLLRTIPWLLRPLQVFSGSKRAARQVGN